MQLAEFGARESGTRAHDPGGRGLGTESSSLIGTYISARCNYIDDTPLNRRSIDILFSMGVRS